VRLRIETRTSLKSSRQYRLLCPIARGLDRVGDRWTLLLLRDLHAGPARFTDLQSSLSGIAPNLLTERLRTLETEGLIRREDAGYNVSVYKLTDLGSSTGALLFELARFGSQFAPAEEIVRPGNLRNIAITLKMALAAAITVTDNLRVELRIDDEQFDICIADGQATVFYRRSENPEVVISTGYSPLLSIGDDEMSPEEFWRDHVEVVTGTKAKAQRFFELLVKGFGEAN